MALREGQFFSPQKPQQGPVKAYSSTRRLRVGHLQSFAPLGQHLKSVLEKRMGLNHQMGKLRLRDVVICSRSHSNMCQCRNWKLGLQGPLHDMLEFLFFGEMFRIIPLRSHF